MNSKKAGCRLFALLASTCALVMGADWLLKRGDPQQTGWQKDEKLLTVRAVTRLRLLWKRQFNGELTNPVLLGPIITHRGIKELVFVQDSSDTVYAVDADLGTVFWTRHLEGMTPGKPCAGNSRIAPVIEPAAEKPEDPTMADDDHFSDGNRPLYALSANGRLYALRPSTGGDFSAPLAFLPPDAKPASLEVSGKVLYATTSPVCGGAPNQLWSLDLKNSAVPQSQPWKENHPTLTTFKWKGRDTFAEVTSSDQLLLLNAKDHMSLTPTPARPGGLATWQDTAGARWIDITSPAGVKAFQVTGSEEQPTALVSWTSRNFSASGPPVVANGVLYFLSAAASGDHLTLHALDALNGKELYNSGNTIASRSSSENIALANGHICLSAADGTLYCFGLPFEM